MSRYRIDVTGITDGISNLNINLAANNNYISSSKDIRLSYSTKQTFIDVHVEDGQIVDTGNLINNSAYNIVMSPGISIVDNDKENKLYNQAIKLPELLNDGILSIISNNGNYASNLSYSGILICKFNSWISESTNHRFFNLNNAGYIENRSLNSTSGKSRYLQMQTSPYYVNNNTIFDKLGQWIKVVISYNISTNFTNFYVNNELAASFICNNDSRNNFSGVKVQGEYSEIIVESLKVISGVWTPENQIDLD